MFGPRERSRRNFESLDDALTLASSGHHSEGLLLLRYYIIIDEFSGDLIAPKIAPKSGLG